MTRHARPDNSTATFEQLRSIDLLEGFEEQQFVQLREVTRVVRLETGEHLFGIGEPAKHVPFVVDGQLKLYRTSRTGDEKVVALVRSQQMFAEAIMFMDGSPSYPVSAAAVVDSEVWMFDAAFVRSVIGASTDNCFRLLRRLSVRLHEMVNEIDRLTLHNATFRLVNFLLNELPGDAMHSRDIQLTTSKVVVASRLSVKPETLSRVLHRLSDRGLVEVHGANIVIRDPDGLQKLLDE